MTDEPTVEQLQQELRVARELLFLIIDHVGGTVVLPGEKSRDALRTDRMIDLSLNEETQEWIIKTVVIPSE